MRQVAIQREDARHHAAYFHRQVRILGQKAAGNLFEYWPGILLGLIVCLTAVLIPLTEVRIVRVLFLGACGFLVIKCFAA